MFQEVAKRALGLDITSSPVFKAKRASPPSDMALYIGRRPELADDEPVKSTKHNYSQLIATEDDHAVIRNPLL